MNLARVLQLKGKFRATYGVEATHLFVGPNHKLPPNSRPYGLIVVEVDTVDIAVGILYHDKP